MFVLCAIPPNGHIASLKGQDSTLEAGVLVHKVLTELFVSADGDTTTSVILLLRGSDDANGTVRKEIRKDTARDDTERFPVPQRRVDNGFGSAIRVQPHKDGRSLHGLDQFRTSGNSRVVKVHGQLLEVGLKEANQKVWVVLDVVGKLLLPKLGQLSIDVGVKALEWIAWPRVDQDHLDSMAHAESGG